MRLAQLARKVGKSQSEIIKFLSSNGSFVEDSSNSKIDNQDVTLVINNFAPALLNVPLETDSQTLEAIQEDDVITPEDLETESESYQQVAEEIQPVVLINETPVPVEVIKAPKIELQGLKVLGKIEVPEVKKRKVDKQDSDNRTAENFKPREGKSHYSQKQIKNPIAIQREKEEQEKQQKKLEKAAYLKELKTQRYLSKVRRPIDVYKEPKEKPSQQPQPSLKRQEPQSEFFITRFFKWLFKK